jgi:hypothetical protein
MNNLWRVERHPPPLRPIPFPITLTSIDLSTRYSSPVAFTYLSHCVANAPPIPRVSMHKSAHRYPLYSLAIPHHGVCTLCVIDSFISFL